MSLLSCEGVTAGYGDLVAIRGINIELQEGKLLGVVGSNGAGKSTLLKAITGVVPLNAGRVVFKGEELMKLPPETRARRGISMVQEGRRLFPTLSVKDNLMLGAYHASRKEQKERQAEILTLFPPLEAILNRSASVLSGGEQQMVAVGRALMARPTCLIIDEPSLGLAPIIVDEIYKAIPKLIQQGMSVILVEQEVERVFSVADSIVVLRDGEVAYTGDGQIFKDNPDALTALYLGSGSEGGN